MLYLVPEDKRRRDALMVKKYLESHRTDLYCLFAAAYFIQNGQLDKWEVRTNVERFELTEETPEYVCKYIIEHLARAN